MSSSSYFHKPENALRRSKELLSIHQVDAALLLLHETLSSRRHKTWSPAYESVMIQYLDLCISLNKPREAKDGLHQYRNLCQSQAPQSLEIVILHLMSAAEHRCKLAQERANQLAAVEEQKADGVEDLDATSTPQSILLSTMNTDPEQTQRETSLVLPHLKFLWETYRAILDILRSNSKLEQLYHKTARQAILFCQTYRRKTEFRRLCDMLRQHLGNLQKYGTTAPTSSDSKNKLRGWEGWTAESIELHLQTRFAQLETASALELYSEAFRTTEDIYSIMQISKKTPKAKLMASYYEKLIGIFWVSENLLFHAFAWYKYYTLCREYNKSMTPEAKERQATCVLLAALAIPNLDWSKGDVKKTSLSKSGGAAALSKAQTRSQNKSITSLQDEIAREKTSRMATLLGFQTHPTRSALLAELKSKGVLAELNPSLQKLYDLVEHHNDPLTLVSLAVPLLQQLKTSFGAVSVEATQPDEEGAAVLSTLQSSTADPSRYIEPMQSIILLKLLYNLSTTYHTVSWDHVKSLTQGLGLSFEQVEKTIVVAQRQNIIVKMDHLHNCLRFGGSSSSDATWENSKEIEFQGHLQMLARKLALVVDQHIAPSDYKHPLLEDRHKLFARVRSTIQEEHKATLMRKEEIERRKEEVERVAQEKLRVEAARKTQEEAARKAEEAKRLQKEARLREKQKVQQIQEEMERLEKEKYIKALGKEALQEFDEAELATMDAAELAKRHSQKANQKKEEAEQALKDKARRLDHIVRAVRMEEMPIIEKQLEERRNADKARYESDTAQKLKKTRENWEIQIKLKGMFSTFKVLDHMSEFEQLILQDRHAEHEAACREAERVAQEEAQFEKRYRALQRRKAEQKRLRDEEAARLKAEEDARKAEEARLKEEERQRQHAAEVERMRQEREERILRENAEAGLQPAAAAKEPAEAGATSSRWGNAGTSSGTAAGGTSGRYVPPSKRDGAGASSSSGGGTSGFSRERYGGGRYSGRSAGPGGEREGGGGPRYGGDREGGGGHRFGGDREGGGGNRFGGDREGGGGNRYGGDREGGRGNRFGGDREGRGANRYGGDRESGGANRYGGDRDTGGGSRYGGDREGGGANRYGGDRESGGANRYGGDRETGGANRSADREGGTGTGRFSDRGSGAADHDRVGGRSDGTSSRWER